MSQLPKTTNNRKDLIVVIRHEHEPRYLQVPKCAKIMSTRLLRARYILACTHIEMELITYLYHNQKRLISSRFMLPSETLASSLNPCYDLN